MVDDIRDLEYRYCDANGERLESLLRALESDLGGEHKPYGSKWGAIDLIAYLSLGLTFASTVAVTPLVKKYFEGLLDQDAVKRLGEDHRQQIGQWFAVLQSHVARIVQSVATARRNKLPSFVSDVPKTFSGDLVLEGKELALDLEIGFIGTHLHIVLNRCDTKIEDLERLPSAVGKVARLVLLTGIPRDAHTSQLCYDPETRDWRYLLVPTTQGFGHFVDRAIDLNTGDVVRLHDQRHVIALLKPVPGDALKYIISPFRSTRQQSKTLTTQFDFKEQEGE